ncbi:MAG: hypothetical protein KDA89_01210 [Planctomycetaceae bacterium]|nr:hypothetical protein [Planctomycetaceae bacterium]
MKAGGGFLRNPQVLISVKPVYSWTNSSVKLRTDRSMSVAFRSAKAAIPVTFRGAKVDIHFHTSRPAEESLEWKWQATMANPGSGFEPGQAPEKDRNRQ